jgi:hypothetical protein
VVATTKTTHTDYLIDKNKEALTDDDVQALRGLSANPSDPYILYFMACATIYTIQSPLYSIRLLTLYYAL